MIWIARDGDAARRADRLGTAALLDDHAWQMPVNNVHIVVVVEHRDSGNASRRTARAAAGCRRDLRVTST